MSLILDIKGREVFDSRGNPTVETEVWLDSGAHGRAMVPSGASTGQHEAVELRDGDKSRFLGKGVEDAVGSVNDVLAPAMQDMDAADQRAIDMRMIELDSTPNKGKLGANAILSVSLACARAAAEESGLPLYRYIGGANACVLPLPMMNIMNGGAHSDNKVDFQEFMVVPHGASTYRESLRMGIETFHHLKKILKEKNYATSVGDEGGFAPDLGSNEEAITIILQAIESAGYKPGEQISLALDVAASELYDADKKKYVLRWSTKEELGADELIGMYKTWCEKYPILSIEDGLDEDDWDGWAKMTQVLGGKIQLMGDDLFVTNSQRFQRGIDEGICNSILIKLNQIGTVTETLEVMRLAQTHNYTCVVSHRSGETEDAFIADFAVATNSGQIKTGSASRTDRMAKYNQLLRIEEMLGDSAQFLGKKSIYCLR